MFHFRLLTQNNFERHIFYKVLCCFKICNNLALVIKVQHFALNRKSLCLPSSLKSLLWLRLSPLLYSLMQLEVLCHFSNFQPFLCYSKIYGKKKKKKVPINFYDKTGLIQEDIPVHPKGKTGSKIRN